MTGLENVGVRSKRKERKHYDEHQDTRCIWEAFGTPSRSPSPTASRPSSPAGAAGRVLNAGFYELHEGGRRAHGSYAHKDRQVPALGTQVWQCIVQARSVSPQEARGGCDLSTEYGFKRLGKPKVPASAGQQSSIFFQWSELRSDADRDPVAHVAQGKSHVGHFGQDSQQTLDCLQMKRCGGYTKSPRSATSPVPGSSSRVNVEDMRPPVLCQEEVRAGMARRAGRGLRATLPNQTLRSCQTSPRDGPLYDDLRVEKHLPSRGGKKDWNRNSSRMAEMVSPRQENRNLGQRAVVSSHGPSEMWAPWLLTYEKELQEQTTRLRNLAGGGAAPGAPGAPVPLPFGLGTAGSGPRILDPGRGRSRSPERSKLRGMAGKPSQEGPLCGRPFWFGDSDSATPESTSHSYYGRSQSLRWQRPKNQAPAQAAPELNPGQPTLPTSKNTGAEEPLRSPVEAKDLEVEAQSSPSRFKHDNPTSLREQLAAESFLAPTILAAGKPIVFGFMDENRKPPQSFRATVP